MLRAWTALAAATFVLAACGGEGGQPGDTSGTARRTGSADLTGAGSTFIYPLMSRWAADHANQAGVRVNYGSLGSGAGIRQFSERTVDFGATDSPMTDAEIAAVRSGTPLHIPLVMGAVVVSYNVPELTQPLRLSGDVVADIFLGRITRWNDERIAAHNPGVALPARDILVAHRTDGSGTTYIFSDFLTQVSQSWANGPGRGKQLNWPVGLGGRGNEGVAAQIKQTVGAVGYVELAYATQNRLSVAAIQNSSSAYVMPSIESVQAAAAATLEGLPADSDFRISIVNAPAPAGYPIAGIVWALIDQQQADSAKGAKLVDFLRWAIRDGAQQAAALDYAPLPAPLVARVEERLASVQLGRSP